MLPEISEIKTKRLQFSLTQSELARRTSVSQSLITKIEAGKLVPSYANAKKLFDYLDSLYEESNLKARDLMSTRIISVKPSTTVKDAARTMKKKAVSQLPVIEDNRVVGSMSEKIILENLHSEKDVVDLSQLKVRQIMEDSMPVVQEGCPFNLLSPLLDHHSAILVGKKGRIKGIITKSDLLNVILSKRKS